MFGNATIIDDSFMKSELNFDFTGYQMQPKERTILYRENYLNVCNAVREMFYLRPTNRHIEDFIEDGYYTHTDSLGITREILCPVDEKEDRVYLFKLAQAKKLKDNLKMGTREIPQDAIDCIKQLGLYQRTFCCK